MGHRTHSAPRHGSLAFRPRARHGSHLARIRTWPRIKSDRPTLLGSLGFKSGSIHVITADDREKTPNFGKPVYNSSTVIALAPPVLVGIRSYVKGDTGLQAQFDLYAKEVPKVLRRKMRISSEDQGNRLKKMEGVLERSFSVAALISVSPSDVGLPQKKPFVFEVGVGGGSLMAQFEYLRERLGKEIALDEIFEPGMYLDTVGVTKGHGFVGPVGRMGIKRKQHKSRKSVREVGSLNAWNPTTIMYTVPRAGQMGFHQRVDRNKRVLVLGNGEDQAVSPSGGFDHFGPIRGPYIILRGSVPGPARRPVTLRYPTRPPRAKAEPPKILQIGDRTIE